MSDAVTVPSQFLAACLADLQAFGEPQGCRVYMARDPLHALEILAASPASYFLVLLDKGDAPDRQNGLVSYLQQQVGVYVAQNRGLEVESSANQLLLTERCEAVFERVMSKAYTAASTEEHPEYEGKRLVTLPDGMPLAAYELNFSLRISGPTLTRSVCRLGSLSR